MAARTPFKFLGTKLLTAAVSLLAFGGLLALIVREGGPTQEDPGEASTVLGAGSVPRVVVERQLIYVMPGAAAPPDAAAGGPVPAATVTPVPAPAVQQRPAAAIPPARTSRAS